jgi:predicted nuclease with RNAse H fold
MPSTTYIDYEENKGFWIREFKFEIISAFIVDAFKQIGLENRPEWYLEAFEDFDEIAKGHLQRMMVVLFDQHLAFNKERELEIIEVFELAKKLIQIQGEKLLPEKLNKMQEIKDRPHTIVEWTGPLYTDDMIHVVDIMIKMLKREWHDSNYKVEFKY